MTAHRWIAQAVVGMFVLSSCSLFPTEEERKINYNAYEARMAEETVRLESAYLGKSKDDILNACGRPKRRENNVLYRDAKYEERWEYDRRCGPPVIRAMALEYRSQVFYFLNGEVAEISVNVY